MGTFKANLAQSEILRGLHSFIDRVVDRPVAAAVELLLIGGVVYTILRFLQGTRGARLVRALLSILAVSFAVVWLIAERFDLDRINVLYPYFILGVFLISLVAFQTELRRLLLRLGEGGWLRRWFRNTDRVIAPVVTAVEHLSRKKIGALMAIERSTELGAVVESGVALDAVVTAELIETIFWPGTPLHDLGVLIRQDRLIAAGCQFPLAEWGDLDRALGSRHRAALGMSHEADAIVIVVSEETGTISVAIRGRMRRALTVDALRDVLREELLVNDASDTTKAQAGAPTKPAPTMIGTDGTGQAA